MADGAVLTIISGTPGAGKTSYAVSMLIAETAKKSRPIFVFGLKGLKLPHEKAPPVAEWTVIKPHPDDPSLEYPEFTFPDGSIVVIDEAQNVYRPRTASSKVPDAVMAMERHRHTGLDFYLITQSPQLLDSNIRRLVGKHIHLEDSWRGRMLYESAKAFNPESRSDLANVPSRPYMLDKKSFAQYESASLHVKKSRRVPMAVYVLGVCLLVGGWFGYRIYERISESIFPEAVAQSTPESSQGSRELPRPFNGQSLGQRVTLTGVEHTDYVPRLSNRPETAPIYDSVRTVTTMPRVAGCVSMATRCRCYTQQGTDAGLSEGQCRDWISEPPFDPWREPEKLAATASVKAPAFRVASD